MIDVRKSAVEPLTEEKLFEWRRMLLGTSKKISVGNWCSHEDPMQVISGAIGKEKIHFEAPPSARVEKEMEQPEIIQKHKTGFHLKWTPIH